MMSAKSQYTVYVDNGGGDEGSKGVATIKRLIKSVGHGVFVVDRGGDVCWMARGLWMWVCWCVDWGCVGMLMLCAGG